MLTLYQSPVSSSSSKSKQPIEELPSLSLADFELGLPSFLSFFSGSESPTSFPTQVSSSSVVVVYKRGAVERGGEDERVVGRELERERRG